MNWLILRDCLVVVVNLGLMGARLALMRVYPEQRREHLLWAWFSAVWAIAALYHLVGGL
jgi:hypothetical protein